MIQPTAPTAPAPAVTATALVAAQPGESAETGDFAALLSIQTLTVEQAPDAATALPAMIPAAFAAIPVPANGKILPVALPVALPDTEALPADPAPNQPASSPLAIATLPIALLKARPAAATAQAEPAETLPSVEVETEGDPTAPPLEPAAVVAALPVATLSAEPAPPTTAAAPASAQPAVPQVVTTAPAPQTPQPAPPQLDAPQLAKLPEAAPAEREAAVQQVRTLDLVTAQPIAATETVLAAPQIARDAAPAAITAAPTSERPHDFTALVDRLVAAREAMQPQSVTMAVRHAEFGAVQLRFQQDANGLSVAMASTDPDFARAVSAAVPPVQAASASDTATFNSGARSDQGSASADGSAQSRSGQQAPRDDRAAARANPTPAANRGPSGAESDTARSGIFA